MSYAETIRAAQTEIRREDYIDLLKRVSTSSIVAVIRHTCSTAAENPDEKTSQTLLELLKQHQSNAEPASNQMYTHQPRETLAEESDRHREETYADRDTHL